MPAQANQVYPAAGTVFNDGILTATIKGGAGVVIGLLSEFSFDYTNTYKTLMGPGTYYPAAEALSEKKVTVTLKNGVIDLRPFMAATGAAAVFTTPNTTLTETMNDVPPLLKIVWKTPADGTDITWTADNVVIDNLKFSGQLHEYAVLDWTGHCLPDPSSAPTVNTVFTMVVTGNETGS
jgi:hypothetical protein